MWRYFLKAIGELSIPGCSHECHKHVVEKGCCPGYWGTDCLGKCNWFATETEEGWSLSHVTADLCHIVCIKRTSTTTEIRGWKSFLRHVIHSDLFFCTAVAWLVFLSLSGLDGSGLWGNILTGSGAVLREPMSHKQGEEPFPSEPTERERVKT